MLKSMTAFGRSSITLPVGRFVTEIQSVNKKFLDVNVYMPSELTRFEADIKKWISAVVFRGQVTVRITASFDKIVPLAITPNLGLAKQLKHAWEKIAEELGLDPADAIKLDLFAKQQGLMTFTTEIEDEKEYREALHIAVHEALVPFQKMREQEGKILETDLSERLELLAGCMKSIEEKAPDSVNKFRDKLRGKIEEVLPGKFENEERILREVALFAEKVDITEEITRFNSHLQQIRLLLGEITESIGKTLEFLLQELNREINTISAKSSDIFISGKVVEIKSEIERIREQIQNVE